MCILHAEAICKSYQSGSKTCRVLESVSLRLQRGEMTAVMGPSGCGKTTLLHILSGIIPADTGTVTIQGTKLSDLSDEEQAQVRRTQLGLVFQDFQLLESLTVKENILVPLILNGCGLEEQEQAYRQMAGALQLEPLKDRRLSELSGGQRQRVAAARAFIHRPALIFADEPTGSLDARATVELMGLLAEMNRSFGTSLLLVTHDAQAASFCDRVLLLQDGSFQKEVRKGGSFREELAALFLPKGGLEQ